MFIFLGNTWMCKRCWNTERLRQRKSSESKIIKKENIRKNFPGIEYNRSSIPRSFPYNVSINYFFYVV